MCVCVCTSVCLLLAPKHLQLWVFSFPVHKANKRNQKPWEKGKESSRKERSLCEKARHWLNFKEKLMDLFFLTILIEQSTDPGVEASFSVLKINFIFVLWLDELLHLIVRNDWLWEKEKKKQTSVLQVSL